MKARLGKKKSTIERPALNISADAGSKDLQYVMSIGDDGAILTAISKGRLQKRLFLTSPGAPELAKELNQNPKAPVSILVDVIDQTYIKQTLPPVSSLNIKKLIKRKLEKEFDKDDLTAYNMLENTGKKGKEWTVLFLSVRYVTPLSDWVDAVGEFDNYIKGIHLLPVESGDILHHMRKAYGEPEQKSAPKWQMIISHNRLSGFRQSVYYNEKIIFTRVAQPLDTNDAAVIAGSIEQEALNIVEYIRRLGFQERDGLEVYIIASLNVCNGLAGVSLYNAAVHAHTPYEIAGVLGIEHAAEENDRYGDVINAVHLTTKKKPQITFVTSTMKVIKRWQLIRTAAIALVILAVAALGYFSFARFGDINELNTDIQRFDKERSEFKQKTKQQEVILNVFSDTKDQLFEFQKMTQDLDKDKNALGDFIRSYVSVTGFDVSVSNLNTHIVTDERNGDRITASFNIEFLNRGNKPIDKLIDDVEGFANKVKEALAGYEVVFSGLPNQGTTTLDINSASSSNKMSIQMQASGNIEQKKETK